MKPFQIIIAIALIANMTMGLLVFFTNPRRKTNLAFLLLSFVFTAWFICLAGGAAATSPAVAAFWIRQSSVAAAFIPTAFVLLLLSIAHQRKSFPQIIGHARRWLICYAPIAFLCQTRFFLVSAALPMKEQSVAVPQYGPGFLLFAGYILAAFIVLILHFFRTARSLTGMDRTELQFMLLGAFACVGVGILFFFASVLSGNPDAVQLLPLSVVVLDAVLAYGIATHRVMDVPTVLRRATAYTLLAAYLSMLYFLVWSGAHLLLAPLLKDPDLVARILATTIVAISLVPANGLLQRFATRLFINVQGVDVRDIIKKANDVFSSIGTLDALLSKFCSVVAEAFGADQLIVLLWDGTAFSQQFPSCLDEGRALRLSPDNQVVEILRRQEDPIVPELVQRIQRDAGMHSAVNQLQARHFAAALGIYSRSGLDGILLLGPRLSGRIYGGPEQEVLMILCRQLAVALENAKLYTQLQDSKIYHEILLDNLVSGVVAATEDGRISVFNREAQRITRLGASNVMGQPLDVLPEALSRTLELTLQRQRGVRDQEMVIQHGVGDETPVRVGSSVFHGHRGRLLGALIVFHDVDALRRLEMQVRRTDRLASVGTLAAGMAHEIKNPLVTVKTFTQLLPERYDDPDFRDTFSSLIGQEVKRIDSIVSQLLGFSRPARPNLAPASLHGILDASLNLTAQRIRQAGIRLERDYKAGFDTVQLDADQLNQAFINFLFNAIEAMDRGGCLTVRTEQIETKDYLDLWYENAAPRYIRISIQDTGEGIPPENLAHIFDPFFTTKTMGTGLGLSVAHKIIQEHGGSIDVESEPTKGTTIIISLPLVGKEAAV